MKLIIAEKPSVASSIAQVMGATIKKDGYIMGNGYIVSWCVGHLIELAEPKAYNPDYEIWKKEDLPIIPDKWQYNIKSDTKKQYDVLKSLLNDDRVETVVCATDAGREGELIFRLVYMMTKCKKTAERLWISSMEDSAIREGMNSLKPLSEYDNLYAAARARQEADWLIGINCTRLFSVLYNATLKVGRVQTPTLAMLVDREKEISNHEKKFYYKVHIEFQGIKADSENIEKKEDADNLASGCNETEVTVIKTTKEGKAFNPPKLYDLTSLQRDANKMFGFTAKKTLETTQSLYEKKLVTYPRTDSCYLTEDMEGTAEEVINAILETDPKFGVGNRQYNIRKLLNSSKVTDHHAIIPTVEITDTDISTLPDDEQKVLYLVMTRLLAATGTQFKKIVYSGEYECNGYKFVSSFNSIIDNGYKDYEAVLEKHFGIDKKDETPGYENVAVLKEGETYENEDTSVTEHTTKPPKRYTEATLLSAMEKAGKEDMDADVERTGLGTPATRADIIEKLVNDKYVKREKKTLVPTESGINMISIMPENLKSPGMTADWENTLAEISKGNADFNKFMDSIENYVRHLTETTQKDESKAKLFSSGIGKCPNCNSDVLYGKFGAYCSGKCGIYFGKPYGKALAEEQWAELLDGKKIFVKGFKNKKSTIYDAYLQIKGTAPGTYTYDNGETKDQIKIEFEMTFPPKRKKKEE